MSDCYVWCTGCGVRLAREEVKGWGCPKCGDKGVPCDPTKDVFVAVNWHELRILTIWAENYARSCAGKLENEAMPRTVSAIARRLQSQWPDMGALTLGGEIAELPEAMEKAGIKIGDIETNIPSPKPLLSFGPGAVGFARTPTEAP